MVINTMPIKYAVPAGSVRIKLLIALAARYTGCTVRGWDVMAGLDTHPASQNSARFRYSFGKTRVKDTFRKARVKVVTPSQEYDFENEDQEFISDIFSRISAYEKKKILRRLM